MNAQININGIIESRLPKFRFLKNEQIKTLLLRIFSKLLYADSINSILHEHSQLKEKLLIDALFDSLNFSYVISNSDHRKIPSEGRLICVANHPIGSLDALALLKTVLEVRRDVKIVVNDVLYHITALRNYFIPFKLDSASPQRDNLSLIQKALEEEYAVIIFPAASVSRLKGFSIVDAPWHNGAVHFAKKMHSPVLPVFIKGKNSFLFYAVSFFSKKLSMFLLFHELFNKKNKSIQIKIGDLISAKVFASSAIREKFQTNLLRKHVNLIGKNKGGIFLTEKNVIHSCDRKIIKKELSSSNLLGSSSEGMNIYLANKNDAPETLHEIARLREITFRRVGEGTGKKLDLDKYDDHYKHLIIWDEKELEIVGLYRLGMGSELAGEKDASGFYTSTLFTYSNTFIEEYMPYSIELGRSFIQKKYWNTKALNYLWQGIGILIAQNPSIKYLFGGVSISSNYPLYAREQIIYYYKKWFSETGELAESKRKFSISGSSLKDFDFLFAGNDRKEDYKILKKLIKPLGYSIPILYKHYAELSESGGVKFLDFGTDPDFENCIDGLILVEIDKISEEKKQKFINSTLRTSYNATA